MIPMLIYPAIICQNTEARVEQFRASPQTIERVAEFTLVEFAEMGRKTGLQLQQWEKRMGLPKTFHCCRPRLAFDLSV
jgi:hypothetical protein